MHAPKAINYRRKTRSLNVDFGDDCFELDAEYLRVFSPSAEVQGHGPGQEVLVAGKQNVGIKAINQQGNYAIRITFDDGHDSGLFTWDYLKSLGEQKEKNWADYLHKLQVAGLTRDPHTSAVKIIQ